MLVVILIFKNTIPCCVVLLFYEYKVVCWIVLCSMYTDQSGVLSARFNGKVVDEKSGVHGVHCLKHDCHYCLNFKAVIFDMSGNKV